MKLQLKKHDRICFLGDSITSNGLWIAEVFDFFAENYPELEVCMYNCGVGGTCGYQVGFKNRMYREWLNFFPTYTVIAFGMNDKGYSDDEEVALAKYHKSLNEIIQICRDTGSTPIICSPTPYDEYNDGPTPIVKWDARLARFTKEAEAVAEENGLLFIDMRTVLLECMEDRPIKDDRVHMLPYGDHLMAQSFLYGIGAIDVIDTDGTFEMSEKNKARYKTEQILRDCMFIEVYWHKEMDRVSVEERKKWIENYMAEEERPDWEKAIQITFNENADFIDETRGELIKRTFEMYK